MVGRGLAIGSVVVPVATGSPVVASRIFRGAPLTSSEQTRLLLAGSKNGSLPAVIWFFQSMMLLLVTSSFQIFPSRSVKNARSTKLRSPGR